MSKPTWELLTEECDTPKGPRLSGTQTHRLDVEGGHLYRVTTPEGHVSLTYVASVPQLLGAIYGESGGSVERSTIDRLARFMPIDSAQTAETILHTLGALATDSRLTIQDGGKTLAWGNHDFFRGESFLEALVNFLESDLSPFAPMPH